LLSNENDCHFTPTNILFLYDACDQCFLRRFEGQQRSFKAFQRYLKIQ